MLESKRRALIFIGLSVLLAALAGFLFLQKVKALNEQLGETTPVFVAKKSIPSRGVILPEQVTTIEMPNKYVQEAKESFVTNVNDLKNKVSVVPLSEGNIITKNMLKPVSAVTNENNRLVTMVPSERINFDQPLVALDRVDIVVSHKFSGAPKTEIFMKDVLVAMDSRNKEGAFTGVALEIPLQDAPRLIHMQNYADRVRILKSNVGNGQQVKPAAPAAPKPAPAKPATPPPGTPQATPQATPPAAPAPAQPKP